MGDLSSLSPVRWRLTLLINLLRCQSVLIIRRAQKTAIPLNTEAASVKLRSEEMPGFSDPKCAFSPPRSRRTSIEIFSVFPSKCGAPAQRFRRFRKAFGLEQAKQGSAARAASSVSISGNYRSRAKIRKNRSGSESVLAYTVGLEVTNRSAALYAFLGAGILTAATSVVTCSPACGRGRAAALNNARQKRSEIETQQMTMIAIPRNVARPVPRPIPRNFPNSLSKLETLSSKPKTIILPSPLCLLAALIIPKLQPANTREAPKPKLQNLFHQKLFGFDFWNPELGSSME